MDTNHANIVRVDHKVRFVGSYYSDTKLTDSVVKKMVLHSVAQSGSKVKLKLCSDGLRLTKSMFAPRLREPHFIPIKDIAHIGRHVINPLNLMCIVDNSATPYIKIMMFKCSNEKDAAEYAEIFTAVKRGCTVNGPKTVREVVEDKDTDPYWITVEKTKITSPEPQLVTGVETMHIINNSPETYQIVNGSQKSQTLKENLVVHSSKTETETDVQVKKIDMEKETQEDHVYGKIKKHNDVFNEDVVDNKSEIIHVDQKPGVSMTMNGEMGQGGTVADGGDSDHPKSSRTTEELQREIHELKQYIRQSINMNHGSEGESHMRPLKIDIAQKDTVVESAPASVRSFKQQKPHLNYASDSQILDTNYNNNNVGKRMATRESRSRAVRGGGTASERQTTTHDFTNMRKPGEARITVADFYSHYGTVPKQNRTFESTLSEYNPRISSSRSEIGRPRAASHHSSLPTRLVLPAESRENTFVPAATNLTRTHTFNSGMSSPSSTLRSKVTFDPRTLDGGPHRFGRAHVVDTVVKPIEKVYATQTLPARGIVFVNNPRALRQIPENVRIVNMSQPNSIVRPGEQIEEMRRPDTVR